MNRISTAILLSILPLMILHSAVYFVSPSGSDSNIGAIGSPFYALSKAITTASAGDTIYMRGGTYYYTTATQIDKSGTADARINIWAYSDEKPVIDGAQMTYSTATERKARRGFMIYGNYYYIKGIEVTHTPDNGMRIKASYIKVENCSFHHNRNTGLQIGLEGSSTNDGTQVQYNEIINCDSYNNCDSAKSGGDADGFACKLSAGIGNTFTNCRSWNNGDDGWDLYQQYFAVKLTNCWTWHNGDGSLFPDVTSFSGNGNGFKLGGYGSGLAVSHGMHELRNCISFNNSYSTSGRGYDQNKHGSGNKIYNCLSFNNKANWYFPNTPDDSTKYEFKNCVSFGATSSELTIPSNSVTQNNSWIFSSFKASASDYVSLAESLACAPRNADGSIPENDFARLVSGSPMIDKGVDVGTPYSGSAPDLGPIEYVVTDVKSEGGLLNKSFRLEQNYPNPCNPSTQIAYEISYPARTLLKIYDVLGKEITTLVDTEQNPGRYMVQVNANGLSSGVYIYRLSSGAQMVCKKMIVAK
jgi:hypothetical protein